MKAEDDFTLGNINRYVSIPVLENDEPQQDDMRVKKILQPAEHGHCWISYDSTEVRYSPEYNFFGEDSCVYQACIIGKSICDTATLTVNVQPYSAERDLTPAPMEMTPFPTVGAPGPTTPFPTESSDPVSYPPMATPQNVTVSDHRVYVIHVARLPQMFQSHIAA